MLPVPTTDAFGKTIQAGDTIAVAANGGLFRGTITRLGPGWIWYRADQANYGVQPHEVTRDSKTKQHLVVRLESEADIRAKFAGETESEPMRIDEPRHPQTCRHCGDPTDNSSGLYDDYCALASMAYLSDEPIPAESEGDDPTPETAGPACLICQTPVSAGTVCAGTACIALHDIGAPF